MTADAELASNGKSQPEMQSGTERGRKMLKGWKANQPTNFFASDVAFQRLLEYLWGNEKYRQHAVRLYKFGAVLATDVDPAVRIVSQDSNLPRLVRYDNLDNRIEQVIFHPDHDVAGRHIYGSGMMSLYESPGNNLLSLSLFYLSSQNGEAGHNCSVACSAGLIKVLQKVGGQKIVSKYLPRLLEANYDDHFQGAQYLTEVQGGSDVGANATIATPLNPAEGTWLLNGEKWFCSNVTADLALVTARVPGQGEGTNGLGLFLVPRVLASGQLNSVYIHRLKEKLGTRSLATGELEFRNALSYTVGPTTDGFKNVMTYVINTSRVYNAVGSIGNARRAYATARLYAQHRSAFGRQIIHFPIVQSLLANMRAETVAMLSGTMYMIKLMDDLEIGSSNEKVKDFLRMAINLNKYRTAILAQQVILKGIEILGGNGTIEDFSVLPRLLRDNIVYENWEGTHNVLLSQVLGDIQRLRVADPFMEAIEAIFEGLNSKEQREAGLAALGRIKAELVEVLAMDELTAAIYFRPLMDRLIDLFYSACLSAEGEWEHNEKEDRTKLRLASLFFDQRVAGLEPKDIAYYDDKVSRLCQ